MANGNFLLGTVKLANSQTCDNPVLYANQDPPPYNFSGSVGNYSISKVNVSISGATVTFEHLDSPLVIRHNNSDVGIWKTVKDNHTTTPTVVVAFNSGYKLKTYYSAASQTNIQFVDPSDNVLGTIADYNSENAAMCVFEIYGEYVIAFVSATSGSNGQMIVLTQDTQFANHAASDSAPYPTYIWEPFEQLSGNDGQFLLNLSTIDETIIGDGNTQTSSSDASKFYINELTSLYTLTVNMLDGQETIIAYCGRNYLTATKRTVAGTQSTTIYVTLKFYFRSDVLIYTAPEIAMTITGTVSPNTYYLSIIYDDENEVAAPDLINKLFVVSDFVYYYNNFSLPSDEQMRALYIWLQDNGTEQEYITPYDTGTTDDGGNPATPRIQDHITDTPAPTCGGLDRGIITLYRPTPEQLVSISSFLWSDDVLDNFKKYFNNFADNIMSLYSIPFTPDNLPTKNFKVGKMESETITNVEYCNVRYFDIDMGELLLSQRWGSYLDYSPYTKIEIYLPYLGLHSLDTDELMSPAAMDGTLKAKQGCTLNLVYRLDILTGVIVAKLKVNGEIRYQFSGKVGTNIPLTGQSYVNLINGIVTAGAGLIGTIATGGLTAPMSIPAAVTATVQAQKPAVTRIGNISGDASMLATNIPYLCISTPNKAYMNKQEDFTGFPAYKMNTLNHFTGFTQVLDAHVEGVSCTEEERASILSYLKEGVII